MAKGEINFRKKRKNVERNRQALYGKMALIATYEQRGMGNSPEADELLLRIRKLRQYLRNQTGEEE